MKYDYLIVGAGFAGAVCAEQLAARGKRILVVEKRDHIGGNAFDRRDSHGELVHPYGPHIFHTNSQKIFDYLSAFTEWRFYEHRVLASVGTQLLPVPINRRTINQLYGLELDEAQVAEYLERVRVRKDQLLTSEDVVLNSVGTDLCEKFFRGYTRKQWGLDLSELAAGVAARIPTRTNDDDRYFTDNYQFMPARGYSEMFKRMFASSNITIELGVDFLKNRQKWTASHTIYCGPIDAFYEYCFGKLPYRSLEFQHEHLANVRQFQSVGTVNFPNDHNYTRITEFKHLTGENNTGTSIVKEYPSDNGEPYYPVPRPINEALYKKYEKLAELESSTTFVGRLAQYRYYNMDQVVAAALQTVSRLS